MNAWNTAVAYMEARDWEVTKPRSKMDPKHPHERQHFVMSRFRKVDFFFYFFVVETWRMSLQELRNRMLERMIEMAQRVDKATEAYEKMS